MIALPPLEVFIPDGDEYRSRAEEELSKQQYQAAKPTWFDRFIEGIVNGINDLFTASGASSVAPFATTVIIVVIIAALVVALLVWGRPRASRALRRHSDLLGERDDRSAAQLRAEAERSAKAQDWDAAVILRFRALARSLLERDLIAPAPGATAQAIAREAGVVLPSLRERLHDGAVAFDAVRYLRTPADEDEYRTLSATDDAALATQPLLHDTARVPA